MQISETAVLIAATRCWKKSSIAWEAARLLGMKFDIPASYGDLLRVVDHLVGVGYLRQKSLGEYTVEVEGRLALKSEAEFLQVLATAATMSSLN